MISQKDPKRIAEQISAIASLSRVELIERWGTDHGRPPPKGVSRRLMEYNAAYQLQVKAFGGLKPTVRRKLRQTMRRGPKPTPSAIVPRKAENLSPGARLVREWHNRTYIVDVMDDGFRCGGETYKSLSQVAQAITGARWSGPRFFGL